MYYEDGRSKSWILEATEKQALNLARIQKDQYFSELVSVSIDNSAEVTHRIDGDGQVWCKTPVNVNSVN